LYRLPGAGGKPARPLAAEVIKPHAATGFRPLPDLHTVCPAAFSPIAGPEL